MRVIWMFMVVGAVALLCSGEVVRDSEEEDAVVEVEGEQVEQTEVKQVQDIEITNKEPFVATSEWQKVKKGQAIPPGLHVRLNMQTGEREAKLLDPEDGNAASSDQSALTMTPDSDSGEESPPSRMAHMEEALEKAMKDLKEQKDDIKTHGLSREELKEALKKFKAEKDDVQDPKIRDMKNKFRSIDELKKELQDLELNVRTDQELLTQLLEKYRNPELKTEDRVSLLTDMEYYVHQIDNAQDFAEMGGLALVIKDLNSSSEEVRSEAAFVIGSATQSNPKVQVTAVEAGALQQLIRMLPMETNMALRSRIMYALSAIVRHFPYAQEKFLSQGGIDALRHLFNEASMEKLQIKAVTLLTDMMVELKHGLASSDPEKKKQYEKIPLVDAVHDQGWCDIIPSLLSLRDHDYREKVLNIMHILLENCSKHFHDTLPTLHAVKDEYESLAKEEDPSDVYFGHLFQKVSDILEVVLEKDEL